MKPMKARKLAAVNGGGPGDFGRIKWERRLSFKAPRNVKTDLFSCGWTHLKH